MEHHTSVNEPKSKKARTGEPGCRQAWKDLPLHDRSLKAVRAHYGVAESAPKAPPRPIVPSMHLWIGEGFASIAVPGKGLVVLEAEGDPMDSVRELVRRYDNGGRVYLMDSQNRTTVIREATR